MNEPEHRDIQHKQSKQPGIEVHFVTWQPGMPIGCHPGYIVRITGDIPTDDPQTPRRRNPRGGQ